MTKLTALPNIEYGTLYSHRMILSRVNVEYIINNNDDDDDDEDDNDDDDDDNNINNNKLWICML